MVILTAEVIANSKMDDIRIGAVQPWCFFFFFFFLHFKDAEGEADGGGVICVCVGFPVLCSHSPGWSPHHHWGMRLPWQHHVGSTRSVQPLFLLFLSANWLTPPSNVFKAVLFFCFFFTVWCLFSVPLAHAAVNRLLEKLLFLKKKKKKRIFWCFRLVSARCHVSLSHGQMRVLLFVVRFFRHQWVERHSNSVRGESGRDGRNVKMHVCLRSAGVRPSVCAVLWATCVCVLRCWTVFACRIWISWQDWIDTTNVGRHSRRGVGEI